MNPQEEIKQIFIKELGIQDLTKEEQNAVFERAGALIFQGVLVRVLEDFSEEEQARLDTFIQEHPNDPQMLFGYLRENTPEFDTVVASEIARFKAMAQEAMQQQEDTPTA